ncbi:unnamed protein product [Lactuca virosa]|uniref:Uncharacterized protein n=1 Tax=Lactuca virosa TaxID=75947 RepID=A0AAU9PLD6_9ASTR|nr:unnamed protein product [Lactuca virosa]
MCFVLLCKALNIPTSLSVFRFFYVTMIRKSWISFSLCRGGIDICDGLPSSIKKLKEKMFFVDASTITTPMHFGDLANQDTDPAPELTIAEHDVVKRIISNYLVWSSHDESTLSLSELDCY